MLFGIITVYAQAQVNAPKREFKLGLSSSSIEMLPGETTSIEVNIYRSRTYSNKEIELYTGSLPEGLSIEIDNPKTTSEMAVLTLKADKTLAAGKYTLLLHGKSTRVTKGISFSILVKDRSITKN